MGRRRKRRKIIKKAVRIPVLFQCPNCGSHTLSVTFRREDSGRKAIISCSRCGLYYEYNNVPSIYQSVDVYNKFIDLFEEGKISVEFKPVTGAGEEISEEEIVEELEELGEEIGEERDEE
ncbi:MAG: hypothetical protein QXP97_03535 [Desulfurococcus sp.]|jgi:transcription elongation factor Elf1|uniref:hypothetical protein n=1 Tax=Desulfurococcus sp. TaxID=51678 RepID=UPI003164B30C